MDISITYRHIESNPKLEELIHQKANKLNKFFQGNFKIEWVCVKNGDIYESDVSVHGVHFSLFAKSSDDSLFKTLDQVITKLEKQISKVKEKK